MPACPYNDQYYRTCRFKQAGWNNALNYRSTFSIAVSALLALSLALSLLENAIPFANILPGLKPGLGNIAVVIALFRFGNREAVLVAVLRPLLVWMLLGNPHQLLLGLAGALLSVAVMVCLYRAAYPGLGPVGISVSGAVLHNLAQLGMAQVIMIRDFNTVTFLLPYMILLAMPAGLINGFVVMRMLARMDKKQDNSHMDRISI